MLRCLSVINQTHQRGCSAGHTVVSLCGLMMSGDLAPLLFAGEGEVPSCASCLALTEPTSNGNLPVLDSKSIIIAILEYGLSSDDPQAVAARLVPDRERFLGAVDRLRALFPGWSAKVLTLITENDRLFATYRVTCSDPRHLTSTEQSGVRHVTDSAIFHIDRTNGVQPKLGCVEPIRDHFEIWNLAGLVRHQKKEIQHVS